MQLIGRIGVTLAAFTLFSAPEAAESRELRIALQLPETSHHYKNLEFFKQLVERRTNGAYKLIIAHSGRLVKEQEAPQAVATGAVEMASVSVNQYAGAIPAADLFVLPFLFTHPPVLSAATQRGSPVRGPIDEAILERAQGRVLWWQSGGTTVLVSKGSPLATPAGIAGKKVRVSTASEGELIRLCGGIPLVMPAAAHYAAYRNDQLFAGAATIAALPARKFWEVTNFVTYTRHRTAEFVVTINERLWQSLPADHRRVMEDAAREAEVAVRARIQAVEREGHATAEKNGMTMVELTREEVEGWKDCAAPILDAYLDHSGKLGAQLMAGYRKLLVEAYRTTPPQRREPGPSK
jgi:C4-dicarboxylate-binding protein DctP